MKFQLLSFLILFLLACAPETNNEEASTPQEEYSKDSLAEKQELHKKNNFEGREFNYVVTPITIQEYQKLPGQPQKSNDTLLPSTCIHNYSEECEKNTEKARISNFSSLVLRKGDKLTLKCGNDSSITFENKPADGDEAVFYSFLHKYTAPDLYLLDVSLFEGNAKVLVNQKTCEELDVNSIPVFSPDRKLAVMVNTDLAAGFSFNGIEILRVENDQISIDLQKEVENWSALEPVWINDREIKFAKVTSDYFIQNNDDTFKSFARIKISEK